jgi:transcriptional regulator with XRE-family HTH domain
MIVQLLRQLRLSRGLTLEQVAVRLGVTRASVSKWEGGHSRPDHRRLQAIADLYEVSAAYLLGLAGARPPRELTVIRLDHGVPLERLLDHYSDRESYPCSREVGEGAFYVSLQDDSLLGLGPVEVQPGSLLLVDPSAAPRSGDLVLASRGEGRYSFMGLNVLDGESHLSYLGKKYARIRPVTGASVVGVVLEAVRVTPMRGYAHTAVYY